MVLLGLAWFILPISKPPSPSKKEWFSICTHANCQNGASLLPLTLIHCLFRPIHDRPCYPPFIIQHGLFNRAFQPLPGFFIFSLLGPGHSAAIRASNFRRQIRSQPPTPAGLVVISQTLAAAGRSDDTTQGHTREVNRLKRFVSTHGLPPIGCINDVRLFLESDTLVSAYLAHLVTLGLAFRTARKILFSLRGATATADTPDPKHVSRYVKAVLLGYRALFIPKPPRPIVSIQGFRFFAQASLSDLINTPMSFLSAIYGSDNRVISIARWRAATLMGFKACLRRSEFLGSALLSPCVQFDVTSMTNLRPLMAKAHLSISELWGEVLEALHPQAILSITITSSKCNIFPAEVRIVRDRLDPSLCAVAAAAFWFVLMGPTLGVNDPFLCVKSDFSPTRGLTVHEVLGPLRSYLAASNTQSAVSTARTTLHGLRHGGATAAVLGGATEAQTKALGRWRGNTVTVYVTTSLSSQALAASAAMAGAMSSLSVPLLIPVASASPPRHSSSTR